MENGALILHVLVSADTITIVYCITIDSYLTGPSMFLSTLVTIASDLFIIIYNFN